MPAWWTNSSADQAWLAWPAPKWTNDMANSARHMEAAMRAPTRGPPRRKTWSATAAAVSTRKPMVITARAVWCRLARPWTSRKCMAAATALSR